MSAPTDPVPAEPTLPEPGSARPAIGLRDGVAVLAVLVVSQLLGGLAVAGTVWLVLRAGAGAAQGPAAEADLRALATQAGMAGGVVVCALALCLYGWRTLRGPERAPRRRAIGTERPRAWVLAASLLAGLLLAAAYAIGIQLFWTPEPIENPGPLTRMGSTRGWPQWTWAVLGLAFSPWIEEFVFRGQLLAALSAAWGRLAGAIASTLLFLLLHVSELVGFPPGALGVTAMALAALAAREWTGSVWPAMLVHFGYNALLASAVLVATALAR